MEADSVMDYPKRDPFFAHRFVRLLQKSCAAMDIGQNACLLLCYIAHTEDAMRYSSAVKFWNEQLMTTMGFKSPKQLNDARSKAVQAGWLIYIRSGHREVGRYWVTIPREYEDMADAPIEPIHSEYGTNSGTNKERKAEQISDGLRNESGTESGKPSIPNPVPKPKRQKSARFTEADEQTAKYIWQTIQQNFPNQRKPNLKSWADTIRKMRELDKLKDSQIRSVFDWANCDSFWRTNILSPAKLRAQWNTLAAKAAEKVPARNILPGTPEWSARSIRWLDKVPEWQAMANRGEISDQEFNRRVNEARMNADKEIA